MKILKLFIILFLFNSQIGVAQLTLQKVNSSRMKVIPLGSELTIKFPTKTARKDCDCFQSYTGTLKYATKDSVTMELKSEERYFAQDTNFFKTIQTYYSQSDKENTYQSAAVTIPLKVALSLEKSHLGMRDVNNAGGVLIVLAIINQLIVSPLYDAESRKTSDKISYGTFGLGLILALLPNHKTYHIQQPKEGGKSLWQF